MTYYNYVHVGDEIILDNNSDREGWKGQLLIPTHAIRSYVETIDNLKEQFIKDRNEAISTK